MITFKEYIGESVGTYACLTLSKESNDALREFMNDKIQSPVDDYHCTVVYSRKPVTDAVRSQQVTLPITARATGYESFDGGAYVLKLESASLHQLHNHTRLMGATYDYDQYNPHVTLSYDHTPQDNMELPSFELVFDQYRVEDLKD